jgi:shikimate 5-dehydrogenase
MPIECTCPADEMPFGRCCKAPTSADVIAGLEMALAQAAAKFIEAAICGGEITKQ